MKGFIFIILLCVSMFVSADQRMETVGGFCHAVTPEGFATANDNNEVFISNCVSSIRQNADGTGEGSYDVTVTYPSRRALPFTDPRYYTTGAGTGVNCVMVDSNNTTYVTQEWFSRYTVTNRAYQPAIYEACIPTDDEWPSGYPHAEQTCKGPTHTIGDVTKHRKPARPADFSIHYQITCRNGAQQ
jgi:hypothetical protein